jgi:hypothetical protein
MSDNIERQSKKSSNLEKAQDLQLHAYLGYATNFSWKFGK